MSTSDPSFDILSCRLRSARQKKRLQKEDFEKKLIKLYKRLKLLWKTRQALPMIALEQPYQKGWKRFFVLREDLKQCSNAAFYQGILDKINTVQYSAIKRFTVKRMRKGKKVHEVTAQWLLEYSEQQWENPNLNLTELEKLFFHRKESCSNKKNQPVITFAFKESWRFVLQVKPHIVAEVQMKDEALERELHWLEHYIEEKHLWCHINKLTQGSNYKWINPAYRKLRHQPIVNKQPLFKTIEQDNKQKI